jgi:chitodextrinase
MKENSLGFKTLLFILTIMMSTCGIAYAQPPPIPSDYSGYVTVNGEPAPDGTLVYAKIGDYTSNSVAVSDGGLYRYLLVAPPDSDDIGKTIEFYVDPDAGGPTAAALADETSTFEVGTSHDDFDLTVVVVDSTPPVISGVSSSDLTTSGVKITWATDEPSTSHVDYGKTAAYGSQTTSPALVTSHSVTLTGLEAGTTYHFRVKSTDGADNTALSGDKTFTTATASAPPAPGPAPGPMPGPAPVNMPPVADAGSDKTVYVDTTIHFNGAGSSDPDGVIVSYEWEFGDGGHSSGVEADHAYAEAGTYSATLTVTDDDGAIGSDSCTIKVRYTQAPIATEFVDAVPANQIDYVVDASADADTTVTLNTTAPVNVIVLRYEGNPHPEDPLPGGFFPKFVDVSVSDPDAVVWPIYVEMSYTDEEVEGLDESSLGIYFWMDGAWKRCSHTGVDTERKVVWAYMTEEEASGSPILIGYTPPKPAEFTVSNLSITPTEIELGEGVTISVLVTNVGEETGARTVTLSVEGEPITFEVTLEGGESEELEFEFFPVSEGTYVVEVDDLVGGFTVESPPTPLKPAEFIISGLTVSPTEVSEGEEVTVSVTVTNIGEMNGTHTLEIEIDGEKLEGQPIETALEGGASTTVTTTVTEEPGDHIVKVDGLTDGFTVTASPAFALSPVYIAGILIIAAGSSVYMLNRGGRPPKPKSTPESENP